MENSVYALLRTRDMVVSRYKELGIPTNWLLDSGVVGKVCLFRRHNFDSYMELVLKPLLGFPSLAHGIYHFINNFIYNHL